MTFVFLHGFLGATLFAVILADSLFLRSKSSLLIQPEPLIARWRRWAGLYEMIAVVIVAALGIIQWMPNARGYPPPIFHTKLLLLIVLLGLAKVRMLRERKTQQPGVILTRWMLVVITLMFSLGLSFHLGAFR